MEQSLEIDIQSDLHSKANGKRNNKIQDDEDKQHFPRGISFKKLKIKYEKKKNTLLFF